MLVRKDKRALIFKLKKPERITTVIPTAKLLNHQGTTLVAVPHRPDETKVLRNLGFEVPDPIRTLYDWPGKNPFEAQRETASFLTMNHRAFCLNSMGLGKTISALWAYDFLKQSRQAKRVLVVCPLSTMERTWADEIFRGFPDITYSVLYGSAERRRKLLAQEVDIYIINTDGIKTIVNDLATRPDIDLVIVDELALYRNASTDRWKILNAIVNKQTPRKVWGLTGAPTPNAPTDAWAQCRLLVPTNPHLPKYFNRFRDSVMRQLTQFKWVNKENALEIVKVCMQPSIRYALDDVVDLPPQTFITRDIELSPEQDKAYRDMLLTLKMEYASGQVTAVNEAVKMSKLLQIVCGVVYGKDGQEIVLPNNPRVSVVKELIDESEGKVIVFCPLTGALNVLAENLRADGYEVETVNGETSKGSRDDIFGRFQNAADPVRVIVANPGTMSHGLTLTAATTIIWFAPIHSNDIYEQACARVRRPGQTRTTVIAHIAGSDIERKVYARLQKKQKLQGSFLDMIKEQEIENT